MSVQLQVGYDGANPHDPGSIERLSEDHYRVYPFSEDGDANYKFALAVRVVNASASPEPLVLDVDWATLEYMGARDFVHVGAGHDWAMLPASTGGSVSTVQLQVPPGISFVGVSPAYSLEDYRAYSGREVRQAQHHRLERAGARDRGVPVRQRSTPGAGACSRPSLRDGELLLR